MERARSRLWTCSRCLRAQQQRSPRACPSVVASRAFSSTTPRQAEGDPAKKDDVVAAEKEMGALSRRLSEMAEETMDTGSKSDRKLMQDVGFSEDLKRQLEERIAQTSLDPEQPQGQAQANTSSSAGKGTQSQSQSGSELVDNPSIRLMDDSYRLRGSRSQRITRKTPTTLKPKPKIPASAASRLVNARDKTSIYSFSQQHELSESEREKLRKEMKERFSPGARPMATTLQGLASLANERIEDAISRGQFKNISRGKGVNTERDYAANSPFLDTTEYFMNKIIQKQEIVPPWIEKQQELLKLVDSFRSRLRNDWRRHSARMIASAGGSVEAQVRRAKAYALAEEIVNPIAGSGNGKGKREVGIGSDGSLVAVTVEERLTPGDIKEIKKELEEGGVEVNIEVQQTSTASDPKTDSEAVTTITPVVTTTTQPQPPSTDPTQTPPAPGSNVLPMPHPFRDPSYLLTELPYHTLAITELNSLTRSYNLMAPRVAQKPYFTLPRELLKCYADVAPTVAAEIQARHNAPKHLVGLNRGREGILEKVIGEERVWKGHQGRIRDEGMERGYGWSEFWRDLWGGGEKRRGREREKS